MLTLEQYSDYIDERCLNKHFTGIACPNCDQQLQFKRPGVYMCSSPLQIDIVCFDCGYDTIIRVASL